MQADRDGLALEFAQRYQASELCAANAEGLQQDLAKREVSAQISKELRASVGTSTPYWFGVKTILKVTSYQHNNLWPFRLPQNASPNHCRLQTMLLQQGWLHMTVMPFMADCGMQV